MQTKSLRKTGLRHIRMFQPGQDNSKSKLVNGNAIIAVADGHGNQMHHMSETGSLLACESAIEVLQGVSSTLYTDAVYRRRLSNHIAERWREKVLDDFRKRCNPQIKPASEKHVYSIYGSTLIWAVSDNNNVIIGQIGDGAAIAVRKDGSLLLPLGSPICSDITDSLCCNNADDLFRTASIPSADLDSVILCTDGLTNHFSELDGFYSYIKQTAYSPNPSLPETGDDSAIATLQFFD